MEPVGYDLHINFIGFRRCPMQTYAGIDLHSSNNFIGVINDQDKVLYGKYGGTEIKHEGKDYLIMREADIFAIIG